MNRQGWIDKSGNFFHPAKATLIGGRNTPRYLIVLPRLASKLLNFKAPHFGSVAAFPLGVKEEETEMKTKLIAGFLLAGSCLFAAPRIAIGVGVGVPVPAYGYYAPAPAYVPPPAPGPGYAFVAGFWGPGHVWRPGYWAAPRAHFDARARFRR
jgi:hypothetical protein